ncbi:MAG: cell division protein FtsZ, partial [Giesbergeria sp.]|nr:cell division protein FtsZ [Giesbergeria sp.]
MSTLQISLAVIGAVLLALIVAYNAWTNHKNAPRRAERSDAPRQEPAFDGATPLPNMADAQGHPPPEDRDGDFAATVPDESALALALPPSSHSAERRPALDALIDAIAPLSLDHQVSGEAALAALPPTRRAGSKPFAIEGQNEESGQWEMPAPGQRYRAFQAGVQLANRT